MHSRAARRHVSPTIDTDKSPRSATSSSPALAARPAGVHKRSAKAKRLSRQQRIRHERGVERADANVAKLETKVQKSVGRLKTVKTRRSDWVDINGKAVPRGGAGGMFAALDLEEMRLRGSFYKDAKREESPEPVVPPVARRRKGAAEEQPLNLPIIVRESEAEVASAAAAKLEEEVAALGGE